MTFDSSSDIVVLHGGTTPAGVASDTWIYDGFDWTQLSSAGVFARTGHALQYHRLLGTVVSYGGGGASGTSALGTWELLVDQPPRYTSFGSACGRPGFQPTLDLQSPFQIATNFAVDVAGIPFGTPQAWMLVGLTTPPSPIDLQPIGMLGCQLQVDPIATLVLPALAGRATWTGAVPSGPEWVGQGIFHQAMVIDRLANPFGVVTTGAARAVVGN